MPPWEDRLLVTLVTVGEGRCPSPTKYMRRINRTAALRTICPSGKDAKDIIKANLIKVDGITENKRGRKIYKDMTVFIESENLELKVK